MHVLLNLMQKKLYMRLVKSFWYYVAIDIVPLSVTGTGFQTLLANQKKILSHHCIHRRGGLLFYTTRHFGFTQKGENIWWSMPYILVSDFAYMQVSKKHLSAAFPLKVKTITIHKGEYSTDFGVAHLVSLKIYAMRYPLNLSQKH